MLCRVSAKATTLRPLFRMSYRALSTSVAAPLAAMSSMSTAAKALPLAAGVASLTALGLGLSGGKAKADEKDGKNIPMAGLPGTKFERSFIAVKPDGVERGLVGDIIARFEKRGYVLVALKLVTPTSAMTAGHYDDLKEKPFFPKLVAFFSSGPVVAMVWQGKDVIKTGRTMLGATNPLASAPGTIRGDYAIDVGRNVCHGSDSAEGAAHEIPFWFKEAELNNWMPSGSKHIMEN